VVYWLARHNIPAEDELVNKIYEAAKASARMLTEEEVRGICGGKQGAVENR